MKKRIAIAALLAALLTGCQSAPAEQAETTGYDVNLAFSVSTRDQFLSGVENAAVARANEQSAGCTVWDAGNDWTVQVEHVRQAREEGYDGALVALVSPAATRQILEAAGDMPVVFLNRAPEFDKLTAGKQCYVGSEEQTAGAYQAEWLNAYAEETGLDSLRIALLLGPDGQAATAEREQGLLEGLTVPYEITYRGYAQWDRAQARLQTDRLLHNEQRTFDVIVCQNDEMALGAVEAMQHATAHEVTCPVLGVDGTKAGCQAVQDGTMAMTVYQPGDRQAACAVDALLAMIAGETPEVPADAVSAQDGLAIYLPYEPVDAQTVAGYLETEE